ncbi:MAG TPA: GNAT family N-acetyltransferase [Vicinamibacterales bacterium]|nr:GNAT family N-acetyltransferase [Vicinamibacterales bacterium]
MARLILRTPRLQLIAAEPDVALAEAAGSPDWWRALSVPAPASWPPPLNDADSIAWFARSIADDPSALGWFTWYVVRTSGAGRTLIGSCGFKGRPDARGSVEIGYGLLPEHQRQGYGTELTGALVKWAFGHSSVERVLAETMPELIGSVRVLEKNGFQLVGRGSTRDTILFELRRSVFEQRTLAAARTTAHRPGHAGPGPG